MYYIKSDHILVVIYRILFLGYSGPVHAMTSLPHDLLLSQTQIEAFPELLRAPVSHVPREGSRCLFHEGQVLNVFMCGKEHLPGVELREDAGHAPDVALHVPLLTAYTRKLSDQTLDYLGSLLELYTA